MYVGIYQAHAIMKDRDRFLCLHCGHISCKAGVSLWCGLCRKKMVQWGEVCDLYHAGQIRFICETGLMRCEDEIHELGSAAEAKGI